jgi:citrate lyase subunit beta/citryl-CoA lyase
MRRSLLFIPGNNPAMLQNADVFGADGIILDLEDAVTATEKDAARDLVREYLRTCRDGGPELMVRVNGSASGLLDTDLSAVVGDSLSAIVFPKAEAASVAALDAVLTSVETKNGLNRRIAVIPIVESARGVVDADAIAFLPRVSGILLGGEDLAGDMEFARTKEGTELSYPRARVAVACRAAGIDAIDTPFTDVRDDAGIVADIRTAKSLGFSGKACIHPNQVPLVNRGFAPDTAEIRWARRIVAAAEEARARGLGAVSLDGRMVDKPVEERARRILERASADAGESDTHE